MKLILKYNKFWLVLINIIVSVEVYAQLGSCTGNSGAPIFVENFGVAPSTATQHVPLPAPGATTYNFLGNPAGVFADGRYTVSNMNYQQWNWFNEEDHTTGDVNGRMLVVNASHTPGEFYRLPINGLCENTSYTFSSWVKNLTPRDLIHNGNTPNPCNVRFEIWDSTDTILLESGDTGDFLGALSTENGEWLQFELLFQTQPGQNAVLLKMVNNGVGGYGNDLAIDDIEFKSCGDSIAVEDPATNNSINLCSTQTPYATTITAVPDYTVFSSHFYQWQISLDGSTWIDIAGETSASLAITGVTTTTYYRSKVAESAVNLNIASCNTISDVFEINITNAPLQPTIDCWETAMFNNTTCSWDISGTQPGQPTLECWETATFNTMTCSWDISGSQPTQPTLECWEIATFNDMTCSWDISGTQPTQPTVECWETATFNTTTCSWDISGTQPTQPTVECWETATFNDTTCSWDISGTQPVQPTLECWETVTFNNATCTWDISGTQPTQPTLECWETATFNDTTCSWDISGTQPTQPTLECWETATFNDTTCSWDISGTQPTQPTLECWETASFNNTTCSWDISGTQPTQPTLECWETATFNTTTCSWDVTGTQEITYREELVMLCEDETITLEANTFIQNASYLWNNNSLNESIDIGNPGVYSVEATDGCLSEIINFTVELIESPVIENIESDGRSIIINLQNVGDYLYSLDGTSFQSSNVFYSVPSGLYTVHVRSNECDYFITQQHLHFYIPKFFTPNNDDDNDYFTINALQYFSSSEVKIFNRYGKLLFYAKNSNVNWDGTFNNKPLPTSDYWYVIEIDGKRFTGHVTLKR